MKRAVLGCLAIASLAFACVDLFHSTDFATLCDTDASAKECKPVEAGAPDTTAPVQFYDSCGLSSGGVQALSSRVCAWLGSCLGPIGDTAFGPCMVKAELAYDCAANPNLRPIRDSDTERFWSCIAKNGNGPTTCEDVEACTFGKVGRQDCADVKTGSFRACDKNGARVECQAGIKPPSAAEPCAMSGRHCVVAPGNMDAFCVAGTVTTTAPTAPACNGTSASVSGKTDNTQIDKGIDCVNFGAGNCVGTTTPACEGSGASISCAEASGTLTCNGTVAQVCANSKTVKLDCGALGYDCDATNANAAVLESACVPKGDAASPCTEGNDTCGSDGTVQSCALGRPSSVKCSSVGLGTCVLHAHGASCTAP